MFIKRQDSNIDEAIEDQLHDICDLSNWICHSWSSENTIIFSRFLRNKTAQQKFYCCQLTFDQYF